MCKIDLFVVAVLSAVSVLGVESMEITKEWPNVIATMRNLVRDPDWNRIDTISGMYNLYEQLKMRNNVSDDASRFVCRVMQEVQNVSFKVVLLDIVDKSVGSKIPALRLNLQLSIRDMVGVGVYDNIGYGRVMWPWLWSALNKCSSRGWFGEIYLIRSVTSTLAECDACFLKEIREPLLLIGCDDADIQLL